MNVKHTIPAVDKTVKLLHLLAESGEALTSAQLAVKLGIAPSTCYRILQTMVAHDWLRVTAAGAFTFSAGMFPLLKPLSDYQQLFDALGAPLQALVDATGLTAKISIKQGDLASTVYRVESPRPLAPSFKVGGVFPLAYGSSGACLLAGLSDAEIERILKASPAAAWEHQSEADVWTRIHSVRDSGLCYDPGQYQPSVYALSAPVDFRDHHFFAAISLIGWSTDFSEANIDRLKSMLARCARQSTASLGGKAAA
jgi:DNA-binding IclR family transcriptional regulator